MREAIVVIDILAALGLVGLVLLQQGKGADMGAAFGSGASQTMFGSRGSANFLTRTTAALAIIFFVANITLAYFSTRVPGPESVTQSVTAQEPAPAPKDAPPSVPGPAPVPEVPK